MSKLDFDQLVILKLLLGIEGIGSSRIRQLYSHFKSFEKIARAGYDSLIEVDHISHILAKKIFHTFRSRQDSVKSKISHDLKDLCKIKARVITFWDDEYPEILRNIYDPPLILYVIGSLSEPDEHLIGIVGTRNPSYYGKAQTERFADFLSRQKLTVLSGMARGIDSIAHRAALKNNSRTIAVIGSGLDVIYPPENKTLFYEIAEKGAVISEYDLGTGPDAMNFPRRNRIISGLSFAILVVESALSGGAMQTASYAFDQNKEIFAIPGNLGSVKSDGTNMLIRRDMARLVTSPEDILYDLGIKVCADINQNLAPKNIELNLFEEKLIRCLDNEPKQIDVISASSSLSMADCLVYLLALEFKGLVRQYPGKMFSLT